MSTITDQTVPVRTNESVREASGLFSSADPVTALLYILMRDHVPASVIENTVSALIPGPYQLTNGWLGRYADDLAQHLRGLAEVK